MSNLLKTELYKLFHSWYFWGIGIFNLLLSSILLLDSKERSSNLIMASLYNIPLLYFLSIVFIAGLLYQENRLVSTRDLSRVGTAFLTCNALVAVILFLGVLCG